MTKPSEHLGNFENIWNISKNRMKRLSGFPATFEESLEIFTKWFKTLKMAVISQNG